MMPGNVRSSEDGDPRHIEESGAAGLPSQRERVPGYDALRRKLEDMRRAQAEEGALESAAVPIPRDAADASFGNVGSPETVIGVDDRVMIDPVTAPPWACICALKIVAQSGRVYVGTGWLIGPRTVVTAGHCVFMHDDGGYPSFVEVTPGMSGDRGPWGTSRAKKFRTVAQWTDERATAHDYGVIVLADDLGNKVDAWFTYAAPDDGQLRGTEANISGYPADKLRDNGGQFHQYFHARPIKSVDPNMLYYDIDTFGGQSGSPIWFNVGGRRVVVGIHTTGTPNGNSGTRIRADVFDNLHQWKNEA
jgi:V8-like Glu-specific endopeptidase